MVVVLSVIVVVCSLQLLTDCRPGPEAELRLFPDVKPDGGTPVVIDMIFGVICSSHSVAEETDLHLLLVFFGLV